MFGKPSQSYGFLLDWDLITLTGLTQTYTNVDGSGIDITLAVAGFGSLSGSVSINPVDTTGGLSGENAYQTRIDFGNTAAYVQYTFTFSSAIQQASFDFWDIDSGGNTNPNAPGPSVTWQDEIDNIVITSSTSASFTLTPGTSNALGTGGTRVDGTSAAANNSSAGNASILFATDDNTAGITGFQFRYTSGPNSQGNPVLQVMGIHDITFVVPEASTLWALGTLAFSALFIAAQKRRSKTSR